MNKLSTEEKVKVVACLVEGNSLRATVRMTGIHRTTIQKLLVELGAACSAYQDKVFRNLKCKRIQCDEIWCFLLCERQKRAGSNEGTTGRWQRLDLGCALTPTRNLSRAGSSAAVMRARHTISCTILAGRLATASN